MKFLRHSAGNNSANVIAEAIEIVIIAFDAGGIANR